MSADKRAIRRRLRERRRQLSDRWVATAGAVVCARTQRFSPVAAARSLIAYVAHENEVPTSGIIKDAVEAGRSLYLPAGDHGLVRWDARTRWRRGRGGVLEPVGSPVAAVDLPCVAFLPVVAWNRAGVRLGRGGGFYDRLFTELPADILRVGLAYECQEVPELPNDPWDAPLHFVMTERRTLRCVARALVVQWVAEEEMGSHESA